MKRSTKNDGEAFGAWRGRGQLGCEVWFAHEFTCLFTQPVFFISEKHLVCNMDNLIQLLTIYLYIHNRKYVYNYLNEFLF